MKEPCRFLAALIGAVAVLSAPAFAADLPPAVAAALESPAADDVAGLAAAITTVLTVNPRLGAEVATFATKIRPNDAAVIAAAAVDADPNAALDIVMAVVAALPEEDRNNDVLTSAILQLGYQPASPPGPGHYPGPVLVAPWTDPKKGGTQFDGASTPFTSNTPSSPK